jgi:hypothetical protein
MLKALPAIEFENNLVGVLTLAAVCLKHAGFAEEEEWRLLYLSNVFPLGHLIVETETVSGVAQLICKARLEAFQAAGFPYADLDKLVERVIIGPTTHPLSIYDALLFEMRRAGITEPEKRLYISQIPLRT